MTDLGSLLEKSHAFAEHLLGLFGDEVEWFAGDRSEAAAAAAELALEHAVALRALFEIGTPNSAAAMLRIQYEALLRGAWLLYAAPDGQVEKLSADLTQQTADAAKNVMSAEKMLLALEAVAEKAPNLRGLVAPLREVRDVSWKPLNAFVHAGHHALARSQEGFPLELADAIVRNSNGLVHMSFRLLARTTDSAALVMRADRAYESFLDVLPTAPNEAVNN